MLEKEPTGHGMGTELEQKDWVNMTLQDLLCLQPDYPELAGELALLWHSPRPFSSASIVATAQGQYLIKRSHCSFRSVADLLQEHAFIQHLDAKGLEVSQVLSNAAGVTATAIGEWIYEVHHKLTAQDIYAEHHSWKSFFYPDHAYSAGQLLAKLHHAAADFCQQARDTQYLIANQRLLESTSLLQAIQQRIQASKGLRDYFQNQHFSAEFVQQLEQFHQLLLPVLPKLQRLWTHNDLHASNMLWTDNSPHAEVAAVIDFGLSDLSSVSYDVAVAIERNFVDWLQLDMPQHEDIHIDAAGLKQFIQGYVAAGGSTEQLSYVPQMMTLAHIDFALYELEYFVEITQNQSHADAAYRYLIEHTLWFATDAGQRFIQLLQLQIASASKAVRG